MIIKKGLSKSFTKEVISEDTLAPSEFKVVPINLSKSYADSPIDEIRKQKQVESSFEDSKAAEERLRKARVPTEVVLDREKIGRIVQRLNTFKKMRLEREKQQEAAKAQNVSPVSQSGSTDKKASAIPTNGDLSAKKQENKSDKGNEPQKRDSSVKNKKEDALKEPSF